MAGAAVQQPPMKKERTIDGRKRIKILRFFDGIRHKRYNYIVKVEKGNAFTPAFLSDADYGSKSTVKTSQFPKNGFSSCEMGIIALRG